MFKKIVVIMMLALIASIIIFRNDIVKPLVVVQLKSVFPGSNIGIEALDIGLTETEVNDISISNSDFPYDFRLKEIIISYNLSSILKKNLIKISLSDLKINIDASGKTMEELLSKISREGEGGFSYSRLVLEDLDLIINLKDMTTELALSTDLSFSGNWPQINSLSLDAAFTSLGAVQIKSLVCNMDKEKQGQLSFKKIVFNKLKLIDGNSKIDFSEGEFICDVLALKLFSGSLAGKIFANINNLSYGAQVRIDSLDMKRIIDDFELGEKFQMTGRFSGGLDLEGSGLKIGKLLGELNAIEPGGKLVIKDKAFLDGLAGMGGKHIKLTLNALENFTYSTGRLSIKNDNRMIALELLLEGEQGRVSIPISFRDFF